MAEVITLGARLRTRREELGLSQAQAARELDVARTAYRLWELEAAKPAPDRWRLISRWLGVSVATMLLAEQLIDEEEAASANEMWQRLAVDGVEWDAEAEAEAGTYFQQERSMLQREASSGRVTESESVRLKHVLARVEEASLGQRTLGWRRGSMRKELPRDEASPALARAAVAVMAAGIPTRQLDEALLLTSELVTNAVQHPTEEVESLLVEASVEDAVLRVVVADRGSGRIRLRPAAAEGGWGLAIVAETASRWGAGRDRGLNVVWFELDLPAPGADAVPQ
jgi:transcriptional regulator with XRE-family HTH domain/anti-sigma regulatory factor (Ser/Thr protein kinase)